MKTPSAAARVNAINPQRTALGEAESAKSENAAPSLVQCVMRRTWSNDRDGAAVAECARQPSVLVSRSAAMTSAEMSSSQGRRRG